MGVILKKRRAQTAPSLFDHARREGSEQMKNKRPSAVYAEGLGF
ncbi:MAG: hypothetical protein QM783_12595 [Phycisphaerales bacterium]